MIENYSHGTMELPQMRFTSEENIFMRLHEK